MNVRTFTRGTSRLASVDHFLDGTTLELAVNAALRRWGGDIASAPLLLAESVHLDDARKLARAEQVFEVQGLPDGWALCWAVHPSSQASA